MNINIKNRILVEAVDDYIGLWSIIREIRDCNKNLDLLSIRNQTISFLNEMLDNQLMQAGNFNAESEFKTWNFSSTEIINKIEKEWDKLGYEPNIGDIVWFEITEKGENEVRSRLLIS